MAEADNETPKAAEDDIVEGEAPDPGEGMVVALSRGVGAAARSMSDGLQSVAELLRGRGREPPKARQPAERLDELLARLKQLVSEQGDDPAALRAQEEFWLLIGKLYQIHRRKRLQRSPDQPAEAKDKPARKKKAEGAKEKRAVEPAEAVTAPETENESAASSPPAPDEAGEADSDKKKRKK